MAPPDDEPFSVRHADEPVAEPPEPLRARLTRYARDTAVSLLLLTALWVGFGWVRAPSLPTEAPAFTLADLHGQRVSLADFRGHTVVLNFWATWCGPCRMEIPTLSAFAAAHPDIPILGIAVDGTAAQLEKAAASFGITYPVLVADKATLSAYGIGTLPTSVIVGPDGKVRSAHTGLMLRPHLWWLTR